jgi:CRISPR-associated protein Csx16
MTIWFVSRHPGAVEWAKTQGFDVDRWVAHLDINEIAACDTVIGTLPVQMAADVCARDAHYLNLTLDLPFEWRGKELSAADLLATNARLEEFTIIRSNIHES